MDCCRGSRKTTAPSAGPCMRVEQGGANHLVYPVVTSGGILIVTSVEQDGHMRRVELASLLAANRCDGSTCRWILGELPRILAAAVKAPGRFSPYSQSGLSLSKLAKIARSILK